MNIQIPDIGTIESENLVVVSQTNALEVVNHEDYMLAGEQLKTLKGAQKKVVELFREAKDNAFKAHRSITEMERKLLDPLKRAETVCASKVQKYLDAERKRKAEEAERLRKEAEAKAQAEAEAQRKRDEDERLNSAAQLEAQGFSEEAEQILATETPMPIVTPVIAAPAEPEMQKVEGLHTRTSYKAEVTNLLLLVQEVAAGRQPVSLLVANEQVLNKMATALKHELKIPGVRVVESSTVVTRSKIA